MNNVFQRCLLIVLSEALVCVGEVRPTIEMAVKIAKALEVSLDYLTGATDLEFDKDHA